MKDSKNNKIDDFFREKLAGHVKTPSPMAWEKLSSELAKKEHNKAFVWWQKAAVIILICISGFLVFDFGEFWKNDHSAATQMEDNENGIQNRALQNDKESTNQVTNELPVPTNTTDRFAEHKLEPIAPEVAVTIEKDQNKVIRKTPAITSENTGNILADEEAVYTVQSEEMVAEKVTENAGVKHNAPPVTIEYRSGKRNKEETLVAGKQDSNENQSFTFKKLVAKVKDVKEGEIGLADLRQAKDDFFALDTYRENKKNFSK